MSGSDLGAAAAPTYQVRLEVFEGPLDLLLYLIEQQELDITAISLARVTDQYLAYLRLLEEQRPDDIADFCATAARLLLIKSRALLPQPPRIQDEEEDLGEDLVRQLRAYRRFKQAAEALRERDEAGLHMYLRTAPAPRALNLAPRVDLGDTTLQELIDALRALLLDEEAAGGDLDIVPYRVTIAQKIDEIDRRLQGSTALQLDDLLAAGTPRIEIIVTLLAILEMIRVGRVHVRQEALFGPIAIEVGEGKGGTQRGG